MKKLQLVITCSFVILPLIIFGQDSHYSMYQWSPLYTNPAYTGAILTKNRLVINYRSQWEAIPQGYRNIGLSYDRQMKNSGWGLVLNHNDAGAASLQNTNFYINYAHHRQLGKGNNHISLGVQGGLTQKRFDPTLFSFDSQYHPEDGFNPNLSNGESFLKNNAQVLDLNVGFLWQFSPKASSKLTGEAGFAFSHLNTPNISFYEGETEPLPMKTVLHAALTYQATSKIIVRPRFLYARHYTASEVNYGIHLRYDLSEKADLWAGIDVRRDDAYVLTGGIEFNQMTIGLSYDANNSTLQNPLNSNGAVELAVILRFDKFTETQVPTTIVAENSLKDTDGDGISDASDKCPTVAGVAKLEGCPETANGVKDTDGDGILDPYDKCPTVAGLVRLEGCPLPPQQVDSDGDGIYDEIDLCPYEPGLPQFRGCNDSDLDGVYDHIDVCPKIYGDPKNYGCPLETRNLDSDGDGVLDKDDKCVYLRGLPALNGCPDSDNDGISDILDDCPFLKGAAVNNGCPTTTVPTPNPANPPISTVPASTEISIDVVEFDTDKSFIRSYYFPMLDKVVQVMLTNPTYKIMLVGHTDFEGSDAYNYQLGQRRAAAIRDYLVQRGVAASRINTMSYGEVIPKSTNKTDEGRQRNRRTEIMILDNFNSPKYDTGQ